MYIVDSEHNQLVSAEVTTFSDLNLKERQHLQEWIAKEPSVLGEDLLIIQKEFDGFSDTKERLDLLALDKEGKLVIIENKLDDSGKDVTWQAIKYASYCSSLTSNQIVQIFDKYIGGTGKTAEEELKLFFDVDDLDDINLNPENSQRIILVAANFRKEVTSSALWLRDFGINVKCFKVSPFKYNGKILVDFDQIIPVKEAEEYTIKIAEKKKEDQQKSVQSKTRGTVLGAFWQKFIDYNQKVGGDYASSAGTPDSWLGKGGLGIPGVSVNIVLGKEFARTEIYINRGSKEQNKQIFDYYYTHKEAIEAKLGPLNWERLDNRVTCRISQRKELSYLNEEDFVAIFEFFVDRTKKYIDCFYHLANGFKK